MKRKQKEKIETPEMRDDQEIRKTKEISSESKAGLEKSITSLRDEDLLHAAEALTKISSNSALDSKSSSFSFDSKPECTSSSSFESDKQVLQKSIIGRKTSEVSPGKNLKHPIVATMNNVSKHPFVSNAVKYYENSKRNHSTFNYAAEIVEKATFPVVNRIEVNLNNRYQVKQQKKEEKAARRALEVEKGMLAKRRKLLIDKSHELELSIETRRRIKFLLNLLRLANERISDKANAMQQRIVDKENRGSGEKDANCEVDPLENEPLRLGNELERKNEVGQAKTEIIVTVKKIIKVISNFRPSSLSTDSLSKKPTNSNSPCESLEFKSNIRDIILKLSTSFQQVANNNNSPTIYPNEKIMLLAKESLDMITKLTNVFNAQLEKAEAWIEGESIPETRKITTKSLASKDKNVFNMN